MGLLKVSKPVMLILLSILLIVSISTYLTIHNHSNEYAPGISGQLIAGDSANPQIVYVDFM